MVSESDYSRWAKNPVINWLGHYSFAIMIAAIVILPVTTLLFPPSEYDSSGLAWGVIGTILICVFTGQIHATAICPRCKSTAALDRPPRLRHRTAMWLFHSLIGRPIFYLLVLVSMLGIVLFAPHREQWSTYYQAGLFTLFALVMMLLITHQRYQIWCRHCTGLKGPDQSTSR